MAFERSHRVNPIDRILTKGASLIPCFGRGFSEWAIIIYFMIYEHWLIGSGSGVSVRSARMTGRKSSQGALRKGYSRHYRPLLGRDQTALATLIFGLVTVYDALDFDIEEAIPLVRRNAKVIAIVSNWFRAFRKPALKDGHYAPRN